MSNENQKTYIQKVTNPICNSLTGLTPNPTTISCEYITSQKTLIIGKTSNLYANAGTIKINISDWQNPVNTRPLSGFKIYTRLSCDNCYID